MTPKVAEFLNLGMRRDVADSKVGNQYAYENYNVRIDTNDGDTVYSATNERGNLDKGITIYGTVVGICELVDGVVLFSKALQDSITYIKRVGEDYRVEKQYTGNLNFQTGGFFDSIADYETDNVTKVYWVDGVNQPRFVILQENWHDYDDTSFDFVPEIDKFPHIYIEKQHTSGVGIFKSGIVQYFFTYSNIHGVETAVVYSSPLFYADHRKRAGAPDDFVECQFSISISNLSQKFDKINVYRAIRTSVDTEVEVVKIANIDITGDATSIIDDYVGGQSVAPTDLFFKGGDRFVAGTLAAKDNTLFLGNINTINTDTSDLASVLNNAELRGFGYGGMTKELEFVPSTAFLNGSREVTYTQKQYNGLSFHSSNTYLKRGDYYNIGLQFQDKFGKWSEPILFDNFYSPSGKPFDNLIPKQYVLLNGRNLSQNIKDKYKRVRAVICYPDENKRNFIAQGVLNPSIYCTKDRSGHMPDAMSSWFFRSVPSSSEEDVETPTSTYLEYRHDYFLAPNDQLNCEVQYMDPYMFSETEGVTSRWKWARVLPRRHEAGENMKRSSSFAIDASLCTLNSPDITDIGTDEEECEVNIVGSFSTNRVVGEYKISMRTTSNLSLTGTGNIIPENKQKSDTTMKHLTTWPLYFDSFMYGQSFSGELIKQYTKNSGVAWAVYPWQADRPFGNDMEGAEGDELSNFDVLLRSGTNEALRGQYSKKVLGNIRYSEGTEYSDIYNIGNISNVYYYRGQQAGLTRVISGEDVINFYSSLDSIYGGAYTGDGFLIRYANGSTTMDGSHEDAVSYNAYMNTSVRQLMDKSVLEWEGIQSVDLLTLLGLEPTLIRYRSTPHGVFKIKPTYDSSTAKYRERVLPGYRDMTYAYLDSIWMDSSGVESAVPNMAERSTVPGVDTFWIGELNRTAIPQQMFPLDINDRAFIPSSDIFDIIDSNIIIELYGDIHYQRWDCLKTYPYSYDDKNQVIDVLSFMVESKVNLDGRYDRYVETEDVTAIDDSFFNKLNDVYNQKDNMFTYRIQEDWVKENKNFPNQFAWSQTKHPGEEIDIWTSVNLASTYQVDGTLGGIKKIIKFGDTLFCFQDKGISQIMFNSNIQLSSSSGVPIELANSGKVDGVRYFTNMEGCKNPWTIKNGIRGVYFFDDLNHSIDRIGGEGLERLSETKGFSDFAHNNDITKTWFDNEKKDIHFVTGEKTLAFSEKLNEFTSFYDYGRANIGFSVGDHFNHFYAVTNSLYTARKGSYFYFFGDNKPSKFSVTYRIAPQPYEYKIFNTADYLLRVTSQRGINHDLVYDTGFHEIEVSTENGYAKQKIDKNDFALNMNQIKKFNIWRTNIPRFDFFRRADGTSLYLSLSAGPDENGNAYQDDLADKRYELHNLKVSYLS